MAWICPWIVAVGLCLSSTPSFANYLKIAGTGEGLEIVQALGAVFTADNPNMPAIILPSTGSDGGVAAVQQDNEVLGRVARPLLITEQAHGLRYTPSFTLASAIYVHPSVTVGSLSTEELADVFSGRITNWRELGGPDLRIKVVRRQDDESTLIVLRATMSGWHDLKFTDRSKTAYTAQESLGWVSEIEGAIGLGTYSTVIEERVHALKINGRHPAEPSYPSQITVGFVHKGNVMTDEARAFLMFLASSKASSLVERMGAIPVSE
jgi:phosphate transport system substrate-binding protein